jgi:hypothetical protein
MPVPKGTRVGGRQKGTPNKRTKERERVMQETAAALDEILPESFKGDAHAYLMAVYKDKLMPVKDRLAAATAAIGYEKPKLAAVEHSGDIGNKSKYEHSDDELAALAFGGSVGAADEAEGAQVAN